jgi:hypothetical protein
VGGGTETRKSGEISLDQLKKRRFLRGARLAWAPWIPTLFVMGYAFRGIWEQKATGLGAVAGGLSESFVVCGIGAILVGEIAAIVLLFRAFPPGHWMRSLFSVLSICFSGWMLLLVGLFFWLSWFQTHRNF